jgi:predicted O-linked N-acetylglucosamine transferase (SPINDLY family)
MNSDLESRISLVEDFLKSNQIEEGRRTLNELEAFGPQHFRIIFLSGLVYAMSGQLNEAAEKFRKVLELNPQHFGAIENLGLCLLKLNKLAEAEIVFKEALKTNPESYSVLRALGTITFNLKKFSEAYVYLDQLRKANLLDTQLTINYAYTLYKVNKVAEALGLLAEVSAREPNQYLSFAYQGQILFELKKYPESLKFFDSVLKIDNNLAEAWSYRALNFLELERNPEALFAFQKATQLEPKNDAHWANLAVYFVRNNDKQKAIECFERCAQICPDLGNYLGALLHMKKFCADWKGYDDLADRIKQGIAQNLLVTFQFDLLSISDSEEELKFNAITNARTLSAPTLPPAIFPKKPNANKIKIGYLCGEYRNHAIAVCLVGVLENHHRDQFEILGFDYTPDDGSEVRQRILKAFDSVHNIENMNDAQAASFIRHKEVDILIDLNGFADRPRPGVFANRAAPVQVNYLGYPGTQGVDYMDYLIADPTVVPVSSQPHYNEKIAYLPHTYMPNDFGKDREIKQSLSRREYGLPEEGFIFSCLNISYKITPQFFDVWMNILRRVPGSLLWLPKNNDAFQENIRREAEQRGISPERIIFAPRIAERMKYIARYRVAGLFLDTLPYNAHATASDALWAGAPLLTCVGKTLPGRVAAGILKALDVSELITESLKEYEDRAVELATHPEKLSAIKAKIRNNRYTTPLFNTAQYTKHLEGLYKDMFRRLQEGLPPDHIEAKSN